MLTVAGRRKQEAPRVAVGDRVAVIREDNGRRLFDVTAITTRGVFGVAVEEGQGANRVRLRSHSILGREGEPEFRYVGNLVAGDLVYCPGSRSGLQYGRIVPWRSGLGLQRWDEAKEDWLRNPQEIPHDCQWYAHETEARAVELFFERIKVDRLAWQSSPGRSREVYDRQTHEGRWRQKVWVWHVGDLAPGHGYEGG